VTIQDLVQVLRTRPVPEDAYRLGAQGGADEVYVLEQMGVDWVVFFAELGLRTEERVFSSEAEACWELLRRLQRDFRFGSEEG